MGKCLQKNCSEFTLVYLLFWLLENMMESVFSHLNELRYFFLNYYMSWRNMSETWGFYPLVFFFNYVFFVLVIMFHFFPVSHRFTFPISLTAVLIILSGFKCLAVCFDTFSLCLYFMDLSCSWFLLLVHI